MSHWSPESAVVISTDIAADILAVQETHLAALPLERARTTAHNLGLHLHHGRPVPRSGTSEHGKSCGVGFLAAKGVALSPVLPSGTAWRQLHATSRLHAVRVPPRPDLPKGLLLLSLYAPLSTQPAERARFNLAMLEVTHILDMQTPTLLMGDFNGSICPPRDFQSSSGRHRPACPLLAALLGPGSAWADVHATMLPPPLPWTYQLTDTRGHTAASRIDLVLANHTALPLILSAAVLTGIQHGGHSPVMVTLRLNSPIALQWQRPRPKLPPLLQSSADTLRNSPEWQALLVRWQTSPPALAALSPSVPHDLASLSHALLSALHHLVALAGGWQQRPPTRRSAYDSNACRDLRRQLSALHRLKSLLDQPLGPASPWAPTPQFFAGSWPRTWLSLIEELNSLGLPLPRTTVPALMSAVLDARQRCKTSLDTLHREMRSHRHSRWQSTLPQLWHQRPAVIYHWLHASTPPWGSRPILDSAGMQCTTAPAVDAAVCSYWVDSVLRRHATVDEDACWSAFTASRFFEHIPVLQWPSTPWTGDRVHSILQRMREGASPGSIGIPISVWRSLPAAWMQSVARLLSLVESTGTWPTEWQEAYVAMIPKASGGTRPQDQRPITVLDVLYRIWSKGVVTEWSPTLQREFLGPSAMGFRPQRGTLHVVQLLSDIIALQASRRRPLWLASFDIEKCFDMLPWWALFRILPLIGIRPTIVQAFTSFYKHLRRRFRYGQIDGAPWSATNGLAQGCPASPDLLNILFEPFHRWARSAGLGVPTVAFPIASISFADDLALVAPSQRNMEQLISAYLEWCSLLGINVTKVQLWCSRPGTQTLRVAGRTLTSSPTFKMVGVVLGAHDATATPLHFAPRLERALQTTQRLRALALPASICSLLWRTTILPQALYGCEIRNIRPSHLTALTAAGRAVVAIKPPVSLNFWRSPEILSSPALGDTALLDPLLEARTRQFQWLHLLANLPGLVGTVHRSVATLNGPWSEPTPALSCALQALGWTIQRNPLCLRSLSWPLVDPEISYPGTVTLYPVDQFPLSGAAYTDGSVSTTGGAAVYSPDTEDSLQVSVSYPRSSTHCELVALCLALTLSPSPSQVLTDSLVSLQLLQHWGHWPAARTLSCPDRIEVRQLIDMALELPQAPALEKVKAHDTPAITAGHPKSAGNDMADHLARAAAEEPHHPIWDSAIGPYGDPVELLDTSGAPILDIRSSLQLAWWSIRRAKLTQRRPWFAQLFPEDIPLEWSLSTGIFRRPIVSGGSFTHPAPPATIRWISRLRAGCLPTGLRRHTHLASQVPSPSCLCCHATSEDDVHALSQCPATGAADWQANITEAWNAAAQSCGFPPPVLPQHTWLHHHHLPLLAAFIPVSLSQDLPLPPSLSSRFLSRLHHQLAQCTAEILRRRHVLVAGAEVAPPPLAKPAALALVPRCPLPPERQLSVADLRQLEVQRRAPPPVGSLDPPLLLTPLSPSPAAPLSGVPRRRWLRERLIRLIVEDTVPCPAASGAVGPCLLELFERTTGEPFSETPGALLTNRVRSLSKVMGNLVQEVPFNPPLLAAKRRDYVSWNRCPRQPADWVSWRRRTEAAEQYQAPPPRTRNVIVTANAALVPWLRQHPYLQPAEVESGESGMALLLLWEIDHSRPFPTQGDGNDRAAVLEGFTKRLQSRVATDPELSQWLTHRSMQQPLAPGLADTHHTRWSLCICRPPASEPQGWYEDFVSRWREYLATQTHYPSQLASSSTPLKDEASSSVSRSPPPRRRRPDGPPTTRRVRQRTLTPAAPTPQEPAAPPSRNTPEGENSRQRPRTPDTGTPARPPKRQRDMRTWLQPKPLAPPAAPTQEDLPPPEEVAPMPSPAHGRATQGPPT